MNRIISIARISPQIKTRHHYSRNSKFDTYFQECFSGVDISEAVEIVNPDIVNFLWISERFIHFPSISKLTIPVIFTMHDQWYATGGCHYTSWTFSGNGYNPCDNNLTGCQTCPRIIGGDNTFSATIFKAKKEVYHTIQQLAFVGVSNWATNEIIKTGIAPKARFETIPNIIDTNIFAPQDKTKVKKNLRVDSNKRYVLFGAAYSTKLKGFSLLIDAIKYLHNNANLTNVEFIVLGPEAKNNLLSFVKVHYMGMINDEKEMATILSACESVVVPSFMDNLPNMATEAMSCGVPVVAFNVGGLSDVVDHKINGYLAEPYNTIDLANGILWTLNNTQNISILAREKVINKFSKHQVIAQYLSLCREMLQ